MFGRGITIPREQYEEMQQQFETLQRMNKELIEEVNEQSDTIEMLRKELYELRTGDYHG